MARKLSNSAALDVIPLLAALLVLPLALAPGLAPVVVSAATGLAFVLAGLGVVAAFVLVALRLVNLRQSRLRSSHSGADVKEPNNDATPGIANEPLPTDMGEQLRKIDRYQFEQVVAWTYSQAGYQVSRHGGANTDGGIDLVIEREGQRTAVQCKQWQNWKAGENVLREFLGAMTDQGFEQGLFVTLDACAGEAERFAQLHRIKIVTKSELLEMLEADSGHPELEELLEERR